VGSAPTSLRPEQVRLRHPPTPPAPPATSPKTTGPGAAESRHPVRHRRVRPSPASKCRREADISGRAAGNLRRATSHPFLVIVPRAEGAPAPPAAPQGPPYPPRRATAM